VEAIFGILFR